MQNTVQIKITAKSLEPIGPEVSRVEKPLNSPSSVNRRDSILEMLENFTPKKSFENPPEPPSGQKFSRLETQVTQVSSYYSEEPSPPEIGTPEGSILSLDLETVNLKQNYKGNFKVTLKGDNISQSVLTCLIMLFSQISQFEDDIEKIEDFSGIEGIELCYDGEEGKECRVVLDKVRGCGEGLGIENFRVNYHN